MGDTQKLPPMSKLQYEDFIEDQKEMLLKEYDINNDPEKLMTGPSKEDEILPEEAEAEEGGTSQFEQENR